MFRSFRDAAGRASRSKRCNLGTHSCRGLQLQAHPRRDDAARPTKCGSAVSEPDRHPKWRSPLRSSLSLRFRTVVCCMLYVACCILRSLIGIPRRSPFRSSRLIARASQCALLALKKGTHSCGNSGNSRCLPASPAPPSDSTVGTYARPRSVFANELWSAIAERRPRSLRSRADPGPS